MSTEDFKITREDYQRVADEVDALVESMERPETLEMALQPCPFCGGEDCLEIVELEFSFAVSCEDCGARGPDPRGVADKRGAAQRAWNRRHPATCGSTDGST